MRVEQLKRVHAANPFRPFTIHFVDGSSFRVDRPEFLSRSPSGRTIIVHQNDDGLRILEMQFATGLEVHSNSTAHRGFES
jgi:hypothetical protein